MVINVNDLIFVFIVSSKIQQLMNKITTVFVVFHTSEKGNPARSDFEVHTSFLDGFT